MIQKKENSVDRLFSPSTLLLSIFGFVLNIALAQLVLLLKLPVFLDNVGSVLVAILGGPLPGMAVGFVSNLVNAIGDPITLYYGILTIFIALLAALFSMKGWLKSLSGCLVAALCFAVIGGALGSCMTWALYGEGIGEGISRGYALAFCRRGFPVFWAQFTADMLIDIPDKILTMVPVYFFLHFYPKRLYNLFPYSYLYDRSKEEVEQYVRQKKAHYKKTSVNTRIIMLIGVTSVCISILSSTVGVWYYQSGQMKQYRKKVQDASRLLATAVDADQVEDYLKYGTSQLDYKITEMKIKGMFDALDEITYMYVYQFHEDGCHVVFDMDTDRVKAERPGTVLPYEDDFKKCKKDFLAGKNVAPQVTDGTYGKLISGYEPVRLSNGKVVAYACADITIDGYISDILSFIIKMFAIQFGASLIIIAISLWYARKKIVSPMNLIMNQELEFNSVDPEKWLDSPQWKNRKKVETGDEIEELYHTICRVQEDVTKNVIQMKETERQLRQSEILEIRNKELAVAVEKADAAIAAKTDFYSQMSHDMRTPMNGIIGLVNLSREENDVAVLQDNIAKIGDAGNYLLRLINDTLDMSKMESKKMEIRMAPVNLRAFLLNIQDMIHPSMEQKQLQLKIDTERINPHLFVMADELRLKQVFMNLLSNAIKFTERGGIIKASCTLKQKNNKLSGIFSIQDTGVGMSEEFIRNNLFQPFSQEHNSITSQYAGTGLGLAIVKNLVDLMGGNIAVESQLGEGTTFTVFFDFDIVDSARYNHIVNKEHKDNTKKILKGKRVLLAEDHPLNAEIAIRLLKKVGIHTDHAENGKVAVQKFTESIPGTYSAILMDIRMPEMDGITATKEIRNMAREDAKQIPIIAMTANAYTEDREMTKKAGMNAHLAKPFNPENLYAILKELV